MARLAIDIDLDALTSTWEDSYLEDYLGDWEDVLEDGTDWEAWD